MPSIRIDDTLDMFYELDNFVEPWKKPEVILLVHGIGGCTTEWYAWVPPLAGKYAVLRVDLRGWGKSTIPPEGYKWSMANFAQDLVALLDKLGIDKVHFVGTKLGGRIGLPFVRDYPERLHSLTLVSTPITIQPQPDDPRENRPTPAIGQAGLMQWARKSMKNRLGDAPPDMYEWWIQLYGNQSVRVVSEIFDMAWGTTNLGAILPNIKVPTLVIDSAAFKTRSLDSIRQWQSQIPDSRMVVVPITETTGRQISASKPQECVEALLAFLDELQQRKQR